MWPDYLTKQFTSDEYLRNIYFVAPVVLCITVTIGTSFYMIVEKWEFSTSLYYSIQALFGCMYGVPEERTTISRVFTLFFYIWGSLLVAGTLGSLATAIVEKTILKERRRFQHSEPYDYDGDGIVGTVDVLHFYYHRLLDCINWTENKNKFLILGLAILWLCMGICFGVFYEGWSISESLYFSIAAMSAAGAPPPTCDPIPSTTTDTTSRRMMMNNVNNGIISHHTVSTIQSYKQMYSINSHHYNQRAYIQSYIPYQRNYYKNTTSFYTRSLSDSTSILADNSNEDTENCIMYPFRSLFISIYLLVGVPIFTLLLGQISLTFLERTVRYKEWLRMQRPLSPEEYYFASQLHLNSSNLLYNNTRLFMNHDHQHVNTNSRRFPRINSTANTCSHTTSNNNSNNPSYQNSLKCDDTLFIQADNHLNTTLNTGKSGENNTLEYKDMPTTNSHSYIDTSPLSHQYNLINTCHSDDGNTGGNTNPIQSTPPLPDTTTTTTTSNNNTQLPPNKPEIRINLAEFIVMEMLRLNRVDIHDIIEIKEFFDLIDYDSNGYIDSYKLNRMQLLTTSIDEEEKDEDGQGRPILHHHLPHESQVEVDHLISSYQNHLHLNPADDCDISHIHIDIGDSEYPTNSTETHPKDHDINIEDPHIPISEHIVTPHHTQHSTRPTVIRQASLQAYTETTDAFNELLSTTTGLQTPILQTPQCTPTTSQYYRKSYKTLSPHNSKEAIYDFNPIMNHTSAEIHNNTHDSVLESIHPDNNQVEENITYTSVPESPSIKWIHHYMNKHKQRPPPIIINTDTDTDHNTTTTIATNEGLYGQDMNANILSYSPQSSHTNIGFSHVVDQFMLSNQKPYHQHNINHNNDGNTNTNTNIANSTSPTHNNNHDNNNNKSDDKYNSIDKTHRRSTIDENTPLLYSHTSPIHDTYNFGNLHSPIHTTHHMNTYGSHSIPDHSVQSTTNSNNNNSSSSSNQHQHHEYHPPLSAQPHYSSSHSPPSHSEHTPPRHSPHTHRPHTPVRHTYTTHNSTHIHTPYIHVDHHSTPSSNSCTHMPICIDPLKCQALYESIHHPHHHTVPLPLYSEQIHHEYNDVITTLRKKSFNVKQNLRMRAYSKSSNTNDSSAAYSP